MSLLGTYVRKQCIKDFLTTTRDALFSCVVPRLHLSGPEMGTFYTLHLLHITHFTHYTFYTLHILHITHFTHYTFYTLHIRKQFPKHFSGSNVHLILNYNVKITFLIRHRCECVYVYEKHGLFCKCNSNIAHPSNKQSHNCTFSATVTTHTISRTI
jgi:hypothetical protein